MKIAVIGVGGSGSAALRFLAREGHEAIGFEQFEVGHTQGSSHGESRIIRYSYPDVFHTRLMADAYRLWYELEAEACEELFVRCGGLTFGHAEHPDVIGTRESLEAAGLEFDELLPAQTRERFPALHLQDGEIALYQAQSGFLRSTRCVKAQTRLAVEHGAVLHQNTPVRALQSQGDGVLISTDAGTERFEAAIVTAGPWMGQLLAPLNLPLRVEQRQVIYARTKSHPEYFEPEKLPVWIDATDDTYGFPNDGQVEGVKFASHHLGEAFDPNQPTRPVFETNVQDVLTRVRQRFPDLSSEIVQTQGCLYTLTPDENFILDHAPNAKNIIVVSGCSGHGFKFTVLLGYIAAQLATGGVCDRDLSPWNVARFE